MLKKIVSAHGVKGEKMEIPKFFYFRVRVIGIGEVELEDASDVDVVEVVRCKDCVYCKRFNDVWYLPKKDELLCTLHVEAYHTDEDDFCSWGERREDD